MILCGDFFQLPPVTKHGQPPKPFAFEVDAWRRCVGANTVELRTVFRQADGVFVRMLNRIRWGVCTAEMAHVLRTESGADFEKNDGIEATTLNTHKADVEQRNRERLDELPGEKVVFAANDTGEPQLLAQLQASCQARATLELKVGAHVILLKNLSLGERLCNGSIGRVVRFTAGHKYPIVRFASGLETMVKPEKFVLRGGAADSAQRVQVPLELGWNFSVHRSQGMSLDRCCMSLGSVFEFGQAYVALSRARSMEGLKLLDFEARCVRAHPSVIEFYRALGHEAPDVE